MSKLSEARRALRARPDLIERVLFLAAEPGASVSRTLDVLPIARRHLDGRETEALVVIALDHKHRVVDSEILTTGSSGMCIVDPAQIFRWALTRRRPVGAVILAHNHPSGDPAPSQQDYDVTERVARAGAVLGIHLLDHVVIGEGRHASIAALQPWARCYPVASWTAP